MFVTIKPCLMSLCILANEIKSNLDLANDAVFIIKMLLFGVFFNITILLFIFDT